MPTSGGGGGGGELEVEVSEAAAASAAAAPAHDAAAPDHDAAAGGAIRPIGATCAGRICSGQVVPDLAAAAKELLENALDAGATAVEVRLSEHGLRLVEVADNGRGVRACDHAALALKHHTSKLAQFGDLEGLSTYGFRGEALSSLAALSKLAVVTRTADEPLGFRLEFDRQGRLETTTPCARGVGTTVAVEDLFAPLPVRRAELQRNARRELAKLRLLLQQYAVMCGGAQLFASDQSGRSARTPLVSTGNAGPGLKERVAAVLGSKVAALLQPFEAELPGEGVRISGLVSRPGAGVKGEKLRQFLAVNGRPVELPKAVRALNDTYRSLYSSLVATKPLAFLHITLPPGSYDVNVTPDKRTIFVQREAAIISGLVQALQALWEPSRYTYARSGSSGPPGSQTFEGSSTAANGKRKGQRQSGINPFAAGLPAAAAAAAEASADDEDDADADGGDSEEHGVEEAGAAEELASADGAPEAEADDAADADGGGSAVPAATNLSLSLAAFAAGPAGRAAASTARTAPAAAAAAAAAAAPQFRLLTPDSEGARGAPAAASTAAGPPGGAGRSLRASQAALLRKHMVSRPGRDGGVGASIGVTAGEAAGFGVGSEAHLQPSEKGEDQQPVAIGGGGGMLAAFALKAAAGGSTASQQQEQQQQQQQQQRGQQQTLADFGFAATDVAPLQDASVPCDGAGDRVAAAAASPGDIMEGSDDDSDQLERNGDDTAGALAGGDARMSPARSSSPSRGSSVSADVPQVHPCRAEPASAPPGAAAADAFEAPCVEVSFSLAALLPIVELQKQQLLLAEQRRRQQQQQGQQLDDAERGDRPSKRRRLAAASLQLQGDEQEQLCEEEQEEQPVQQRKEGRREGDGADAVADGPPDEATAELAAVFDKADFARMAPLGQFNLGFIVAALRGDLFIVDQHAADEKSTFERLSASLVLNKQPLLAPKRLPGLTSLDFQVVRDHLDVFRRSGFEFVEAARGGQLVPLRPTPAGAAAAAECDPPGGVCVESGPGLAVGMPMGDEEGEAVGELLLAAVPYSRGTQFGEEEVAEMVEAISAGEGSPATGVRPKRVRAMLASRACRSSIMIGRALDARMQATILSRLAELDAPWNCPHGRPTMRHLAVLPVRQRSWWD